MLSIDHMGEYHVATSIEDALEKLSRCENDSQIIAGGQTMMLLIRQGLINPDLLVDISKIEQMRGVVENKENIRIGAATTYSELKRSSVIEKEFSYYKDALSEIAGPQVRNQGTIGGGLVYGDPALDTPPVLLTLDAELEIQSLEGIRRVKLEDFFVDYYETAIKDGEILTGIIIPKLPKLSAGKYRTMTPRHGDYALAGVCVRLTLNENKECICARIGLTNGGDIPKRAITSEKILEGTLMHNEIIEDSVKCLGDVLEINEDIQTPKSYREKVFDGITRQTIIDVRSILDGVEQ